MENVSRENVLTYSVFKGIVGFDAARRSGKNEITVLSDEDISKVTTLHVKQNNVLQELEKHIVLRPWGDSLNTVPNMRLFEGSLTDFLDELKRVYELKKI